MSGSERVLNPGLKKLGSVRRKPVGMSEDPAVTFELLHQQKSLPLLITPAVDDLDLTDWAAANLELIERCIQRHGGILFRGFGVSTAAKFDEFIRAVSTELVEYREPATPRTHVGGSVYTSTDFPPAQRIFMHSENSHCMSWPLRLFFFCDTPAERGGETPIADTRRIYERMDKTIRDKFLEKKIMYVRNFGDGLALPWQAVFNTDDRAEVERYCRGHMIEATWKDRNRLRIRYVRPAVTEHPGTKELVWFNHVPLFHIDNVEPEVRRSLLAQFKEEDLPYNAYYGDGSRIETSEIETICDVYRHETALFQWRPGDILMIDNMLAAHGREPYEGAQRRILVGMAEPVTINADQE